MMIDRRLRRELVTARRFSLNEFPAGTRGRATGVARPSGRALVAPLSGRACVFYTVAVDELSVLDLDGHTGPTHELARKQDVVTFLLDDGGRPAVIDPTHARFWAWCHHETTDVPHDLLDRLSPVNHNWSRSARLLCREAIIEVGATIIIVGSGTREFDPEEVPTSIYRDGHATRLRFRGSARLPLVICDHLTALRS